MRLATLTLAAGMFGGAAFAAELYPQDVTFDDYGGIEKALTDSAGDIANGEAVMTDRGKGNCVACHAVSALSYAQFHGEVGPTLDGAGDRWTEAELRGLVTNAKMTFEGSVMPAFYKISGFVRPGDGYTGKPAPETLEPILSAQEIEDVVAFLMTDRKSVV